MVSRTLVSKAPLEAELAEVWTRLDKLKKRSNVATFIATFWHRLLKHVPDVMGRVRLTYQTITHRGFRIVSACRSTDVTLHFALV